MLDFLRRQFDLEIPTVESAENVLFERLLNAGLVTCRKCNRCDFSKSVGTRMSVCNWCKNKQSFTASTLFHGMKRAVTREYLFFIYLLEKGILLNASEFARNSSVAYSTSLTILKKCAIVIEQCMKSSETKTIHCSQLASVICRRSKETPAGEHPRMEQNVLSLQARNADKNLEQQGIATGSENSNDHILSLPAEQKILYEMLNNEPIFFDQLCVQSGLATGLVSGALMMLELAGLVECKADMYSRKQRHPEIEASAEVDCEPEISKSAIEYIRTVYQGISQKCSQLYLALHWFQKDKTRWSEGKLLQACFRSEPVTYRQILSYKSPALLKISPAA
jgi:hypothetical protein